VGPAGEFHARPVPDPAVAAVWVHRVDAPAVVLGSSQPDTVVDRAAAARLGLEVARRRSGGGLVLVHPDHSRWVDVIVPRDHVRWADDVGAATHWLGRAWVEAVAAAWAGPAPAPVAHHRGPMVRNRWSALVCFAGLGPGEVTAGGAKVVGISQRRTRHWARFQCLVVDDPGTAWLAAVVSPAALPGPREELTSLGARHPVDLDVALERFVGAVTAGSGDGGVRAADK
jgi:lipoate-protein ligase A